MEDSMPVLRRSRSMSGLQEHRSCDLGVPRRQVLDDLEVAHAEREIRLERNSRSLQQSDSDEDEAQRDGVEDFGIQLPVYKARNIRCEMGTLQARKREAVHKQLTDCASPVDVKVPPTDDATQGAVPESAPAAAVRFNVERNGDAGALHGRANQMESEISPPQPSISKQPSVFSLLRGSSRGAVVGDETTRESKPGGISRKNWPLKFSRQSIGRKSMQSTRSESSNASGALLNDLYSRTGFNAALPYEKCRAETSSVLDALGHPFTRSRNQYRVRIPGKGRPKIFAIEIQEMAPLLCRLGFRRSRLDRDRTPYWEFVDWYREFLSIFRSRNPKAVARRPPTLREKQRDEGTRTAA